MTESLCPFKEVESHLTSERDQDVFAETISYILHFRLRYQT